MIYLVAGSLRNDPEGESTRAHTKVRTEKPYFPAQRSIQVYHYGVIWSAFRLQSCLITGTFHALAVDSLSVRN